MAAKSGTNRFVSVREATPKEYSAPLSLKPLHNRYMHEAIFDATGLDIYRTAAWSGLDRLSDRIYVDSLDLVPESICQTDKGDFAAAGTVHVTLRYANDDTVMSCYALPAQVRGHFEDGGKAVIDALNIDTASFYG